MPSHLADPDHNPSFTKAVFLGLIREDLVFPFPELGKEEPRLGPGLGVCRDVDWLRLPG